MVSIVKNGVTLNRSAFGEWSIPTQTLANGVTVPYFDVEFKEKSSISIDRQMNALTQMLSSRTKSPGVFTTELGNGLPDLAARGVTGIIKFDSFKDGFAGQFPPWRGTLPASPGHPDGQIANNYNVLHGGYDFQINVDLDAWDLYVRYSNRTLDNFGYLLSSGQANSKIGVTYTNIARARSNLDLDFLTDIFDHEGGGHGMHPLAHTSPNHDRPIDATVDIANDPVYQIEALDLYNSEGLYVSGAGIFGLGASTEAQLLGAIGDDAVLGRKQTDGKNYKLDPNSHDDQELADNARQLFADVPEIIQSISGIFGSSLGRLIGGSNLAIGTAAGSVLSAAALTIGKLVFEPGTLAGAHTFYDAGQEVTETVYGPDSVFKDFVNNVAQIGVNASIGAASSYLAAEFAQSIGLNGPAGEVFSFAAGNVLQYVVTQVVQNGGHIEAAIASLNSKAFGTAFEGAVGAFIGQKLATLVVTPHTVAEATLASLVSAVGAYFGAKEGAIIGGELGGPIGAAIGAFVGYIVGDLIGSLFGHHKPRVPSAMAETVLQIPYAQYGLGTETSANGGDLGFAESMAKAARDTLNGIIAQISHSPTPLFVSNISSPTQTYGYSGNQIYVKLNGVQNNVTTADQAVDQGVLYALPQTKIIGGDIILKRAVANGHWANVVGLLGDLQIASDYETYLC